MPNIKILFFSIILSATCLIQREASAKDTLSWGSMPMETLVKVMEWVVDDGPESASQEVQQDTYANEIRVGQNDEFANETVSAVKQEGRMYFNCRMVNFVWKAAIEDTIRRKELLKPHLTPKDNLRSDPPNEMLKTLAHLITGLKFTGWSESDFPQASGIISAYDLKEVIDISIESNVASGLFDYLEVCPKINKVSLIGNLRSDDLAYIDIPKLFAPDFRKLRYLNLSGNNLKGHALSIIYLSSQMSNLIILEELHLANNNITQMSMCYLDWLKPDSVPALKVLNLNSNPWPTSNLVVERIIEKILMNFPMLTTVNVENCELNESYLAGIVERTHKIIKF
jgi:hypothetical protein